jgi:hypothetical protein
MRSPGWKLTQGGDLFDVKDAPLVEKAVPADSKDAEARTGREKLQKVLDTLNPAGSKVDKPHEERTIRGKKVPGRYGNP